MIDAYDFLETVQKSHADAEPGVRLATIDPAYSTGNPKVQFDGEDTVTTKEYVCLDSYSPRANDRVVMHRIAHNYIIVGSVEQASEFYVDKDIVVTGSFSADLDAGDLVTGIVPDGRIQGDYTGLGNITVTGTASIQGLVDIDDNLNVEGTITVGDTTNPVSVFTADQSGGNKLIVRTENNPPSNENMFEVRSSGNAIRFSVEHDGGINTSGTRLWDETTDQLRTDSALRPIPDGTNVGAASTGPTAYPSGMSVSGTIAGAQGWPLSTGARSVVLTVKGSDVAGWQLLMDDNNNTVKMRAIDHTDSTWGPWQNLN